MSARDDGLRLALSAWLVFWIVTAAAPAQAEANGASDGLPSLHVAATMPVLGALTRAIGGERIEVTVLTLAQQDPHFVTPRPTLMRTVAKTDALVETGLGMEIWLERVVTGSGNARVRPGGPARIVAGVGIAALEVPRGNELSRSHGDVHPQGNPHAWFDPLVCVRFAANIAEGLTRVDPAGAQTYARNSASFVEALNEKMEEWAALAAPLRGRKFVSYHTTWSYLAARFGFEIPFQVEVRPGIPPSARHRDSVLEAVRANAIPALLTAPYYDRRALEYIAEATGARVLVLPVQPNADSSGQGYFALIDEVLAALVAAVEER